MSNINVTSITTSRKLFKLTGWKETIFEYDKDGDLMYCTATPQYKLPAYDLGFLLRKMPYKIVDKGFLHVSMGSVSAASYQGTGGNESVYYRAKTPEEAVAQLAIMLIKDGVIRV